MVLYLLLAHAETRAVITFSVHEKRLSRVTANMLSLLMCFPDTLLNHMPFRYNCWLAFVRFPGRANSFLGNNTPSFIETAVEKLYV